MNLKATRRVRRMLTLVTVVALALSPAVACSQNKPAQHDHSGHGTTQSGAPKAAADTTSHRHEAGMVGAVDASMGEAAHDHGGMNEALHMELTPTRRATRADSLRAESVLAELRIAIAKYRDTSRAVADGYRMFMPNLKNQRVYHFTHNGRAFAEAFRFDPKKPTSLLYKRDPSGRLQLVGAMYTAPKRVGVDKLEERIPLSIARWHKHVNWCVPGVGQRERWLEMRDGQPVFGPRSPIATRDKCDDVGGRFFPSIFGWMVHVNAFASSPAEVWTH